MANIKYEVIDRFGVLSESAKGWTKELRSISWNDRDPKFDIREWSPDGEKMGKGITVTKDELIKLRDMLNTMEL
ncbi:PC4/YdbC family ssDNA-binding protein [Bacillus sp. SM2101]|uniref:YdbC family protein n=1 Tax=Bacillus sp. SM2101 TaxID=2805366 RepID=UPI001BDDCE04|nr:PC4/YdbC family ssDNA-binding protein [Bacillus sp. SM2101]